MFIKLLLLLFLFYNNSYYYFIIILINPTLLAHIFIKIQLFLEIFKEMFKI